MRQLVHSAQGDILSPTLNVLKALQGPGSTWCIKHTRAYPSRVISAPEAGATVVGLLMALIGLTLVVGMTLKM
jgi:hypothetical protein